MKKENIDKELLQREIDFLKELVLPERFEVLQKVVGNRTEYITVCLENIFYGQNASAIIRSCEAFGVQQVHVIETLCDFIPNVNIVRGTDKWVDIHKYTQKDATEEVVRKLKKEGYRIVSTSPHASGTACEDFDISKGKVALFFGTEKTGISDTLKSLTDEFITIPMYGFVESLNVSVCSAIALQSLSKKLRDSNVQWQLSPDQQLEMLNRWMKQSVKDSTNILKQRLNP